MLNQTVTLDLELGCINYYIIKEIEHICFKYSVGFSAIHNGGLLSRTYTIKLTSNPESRCSAQSMKNSIISQIESYQE